MMATSVTPTTTSSTPCWRIIVRVVPPTSLNNLPSGAQTEQAVKVGDGEIICNNYENGGEIKYSLGLDEMYKFSFDSIFGPGTNQIDLFSYLEEHVDKAFNRSENASIFVLGSKGSGRKHTLLGKSHGDQLQVGLGIIPRTISHFLQKMKRKKKNPLLRYKLSLSICGVENDTVDDLIHTSNKRLRQEETAENNDVVLPDLSEKYIDNINQAIKILKRVLYRKKRGKKKNSYSNSEAEQHVIFKVKLEKWYRVDPTSPAVQNSNDKASSQNTKPESSPKFNVIGGTTPAKHTASKKNWKCNTSYIRFVRFADLSSSKATNNDVSAENVN